MDDHAAAIELVLRRGESGGVYNVPGTAELTNLELTRRILAQLARPEALIRHVADQPGHDRRYKMDGARIAALGWSAQVPVEEGLAETVRWYRDHEDWWRPLKSGEWHGTTRGLYGARLAGSTPHQAEVSGNAADPERPTAVNFGLRTLTGGEDRRHRRGRAARQRAGRGAGPPGPPGTGRLRRELVAAGTRPGSARTLATLVRARRPDLVLHAAAWTDGDGCAREPEVAMRRNGAGDVDAGRGVPSHGRDLLYVSTNEVFDGQRTDGGPYDEDDPVAPANPYGASKRAGEEAVLAAYGSRPRAAGLDRADRVALRAPRRRFPGGDPGSRRQAAATARPFALLRRGRLAHARRRPRGRDVDLVRARPDTASTTWSTPGGRPGPSGRRRSSTALDAGSHRAGARVHRAGLPRRRCGAS